LLKLLNKTKLIMNNTISLDKAKAMTALFRLNREVVLGSDYQGKNIIPICETFDRAVFDKILALPGCVGLRIYHGMTEDLQLREIIVGVNASNEDMLPSFESSTSTSGTTSTEGEEDEEPPIAEDGFTCPPICPPPSELNP
jgi:hypothetical protein